MNHTASNETIWALTPLHRKTQGGFSSDASINLSKDNVLDTNSELRSGRESSQDTVKGNASEYINQATTFYSSRRLSKQTTFNNEKTHVSQKWQGYVTSVDDEASEFTAIIFDLTSPNMPKEEVVFDANDLSSYDIAMLKEGAIFYWTIGHTLRGETKSKTSEIYFQRLRNLTPKQTKFSDSDIDDCFSIFDDIY